MKPLILNWYFLLVFWKIDCVNGYFNPCMASTRQADVAIPKDHSHRQRRAVTSQTNRIWKNGIIPYKISEDFHGKERVLIEKAILRWEMKTCLSFLPALSEVEFVIFQKNDKCGCCSYVGRMGHNQSQGVNLADHCMEYGVILHEIGHVIGFWHEHTRPDRDQFIRVFTRNIQPGEKKNFLKKSPEEVDSLGARYDYGSLMHYSRNTFSRNLFDDAIQPKYDPTIHIGQRERISDLDALQAKLLYKCKNCFHTLTKSTGIISYSTDAVVTGIQQCQWRIFAPVGHKIMLIFLLLQFMGTCEDSYIEIRNGKHQNSRLLGKYCRDKRPPKTFISLSENIFISIFFNKRGGNGIGEIKLSYTVLCGGHLTKDGVIESPNYPQSYGQNEICEWNIELAKNSRVAIDFQLLRIEKSDNCLHDYVEIIDGITSRSLGKYCRMRDVKNYLATSGNVATIRFRSDSDKTKLGFSLKFFTEIDECLTNNGNCSHVCINMIGGYKCECPTGYQLHSNGRQCEASCVTTSDVEPGDIGVIQSPSYPSNYGNGLRCKWTLIGKPGFQIHLSFLNFKLPITKECKNNSDFVEVFENDGKSLATLCGAIPSPLKVVSSHDKMVVVFHTDEKESGRGFYGTFQLDKDECKINNGGCHHICRNLIPSFECSCRFGYVLMEDKRTCKPGNCERRSTKQSGWISSPDFPDVYPGSNQCAWTLSTTPGQKYALHLTTASSKLHSLEQCPLSLQTYTRNKWTHEGNFCSFPESRKSTIFSSSNMIKLIFKSTPNDLRSKFNVSFNSVCGGNLHATKEFQSIFSHVGYPQRTEYPPNKNCLWLINTKGKRKRIHLKFKSFLLENEPCTFDYLSLYDGNSKDAPLLGKFCGSKIYAREFYSSGKTLLLNFVTDKNVNMLGFELLYRKVNIKNIITNKLSQKPVDKQLTRRRDFFVFDTDSS